MHFRVLVLNTKNDIPRTYSSDAVVKAMNRSGNHPDWNQAPEIPQKDSRYAETLHLENDYLQKYNRTSEKLGEYTSKDTFRFTEDACLKYFSKVLKELQRAADLVTVGDLAEGFHKNYNLSHILNLIDPKLDCGNLYLFHGKIWTFDDLIRRNTTEEYTISQIFDYHC